MHSKFYIELPRNFTWCMDLFAKTECDPVLQQSFTTMTEVEYNNFLCSRTVIERQTIKKQANKIS